MDSIKEAFSRAKADIHALQQQIALLVTEVTKLKVLIDRQTDQQITSIQQRGHQKSPTENLNELHNKPLYGLKSPNSTFSTGSEGVPTDRQTDQQTDRPAPFFIKSSLEAPSNIHNTDLTHISHTLESLDSIKNELKTKFKSLTKQEMLVFSLIYQLENEGLFVDYALLASKVHLTESSIRDYVLKMTKKGIPLLKIKENNKKVILKIPQEVKQMASLQTIMALKNL